MRLALQVFHPAKRYALVQSHIHPVVDPEIFRAADDPAVGGVVADGVPALEDRQRAERLQLTGQTAHALAARFLAMELPVDQAAGQFIGELGVLSDLVYGPP